VSIEHPFSLAINGAVPYLQALGSFVAVCCTDGVGRSPSKLAEPLAPG